MTYTQTCEHFANLGQSKVAALKRSPLGFGVGALLAGAYIGIALILALTCSAGLPPGVRPLVNGSVFGLGLLLVVFSGAELFTGHVMYMTLGVARRTVSPLDALGLWVFVWIGNLIGSIVVVGLFAKGGGGSIYAAPAAFLHDYVTKKETATVLALLCRAVLCNWLVCLALWVAGRIQNEAAKIWAMAWCLLAFVACGFEHSVANMSVVALGLFDPIPAGTLYGAAYNLAWATLGNIIGGALLVAGAYLAASTSEAAVPPPGAEAARQA
jgi:nitrite transporter NirC